MQHSCGPLQHEICVCWQAELLEAIEDAGFEGKLLQEADSNALTLQIEGMTCSSCSSAVESALRSQKGVVSAAVNLLAGRAEVPTLCGHADAHVKLLYVLCFVERHACAVARDERRYNLILTRQVQGC